MKKRYIALIAVIAVLAAVRLALPYLILDYINRSMAGIKGFKGSLETVDLHLYRGAYSLRNLSLDKVDPDTGERSKFLKADVIDLALEWGALLHGSIRGSIVVENPQLIFTKEKVKTSDVGKATIDYRQLARKLMPLRVNRLEIINGSIRYTDELSTPKVDIALRKAHITATNLTNIVNKDQLLPSTITADADAYGGKFDLHMKLNPLAKWPTFEMKLAFKDANLVYINDFFKAYGKFDISGGIFNLYAEFAARDGKFTGYLKPLIIDLKILGPKPEENDGILHKMWELFVAGLSKVITNPNKNQIATRIPISGEFKDPSIGFFQGFWELLSNAFISALIPKFDENIRLNSVKP